MSTENSTTETVQASTQDSGQTLNTVETSVQPSQTDNANIEAASAVSKDQGGKTPQNVPAQQTYTPNFKFKVLDKEQEFDESLKTFVTDEKKEKLLRELYTKAHGIDLVKENYSKSKQEFDGYKQSIEPKLKTFDFLNTIVQNKDWDTFFGKLKVLEQEIFDWVSKRIDLMNAGPQQQAEYQRQMALKEQSYAQSSQLAEMQNLYQSQAVQTRTFQLDSLLNRQDVTKYAQAWDERSGQVGAFRQLIIDEAAANYHMTGRDLSTEEAVNHVIAKFGKVIPVQQQQASQDFGQSQAPQAPKQVPIIPNIHGKGTSPVKKVPKSLDDLRAMAKALE